MAGNEMTAYEICSCSGGELRTGDALAAPFDIEDDNSHKTPESADRTFKEAGP